MSNYGPRVWRPGQEGTAMKGIDAVIRQGSLDEVRERLTNIGVEGLTVTEVIEWSKLTILAERSQCTATVVG
jgi:hypothetical protein